MDHIKIFLFIIAPGLLIGLLLGHWIFVWGCSNWQTVYRCEHCGRIGPWPYMSPTQPCGKCGNKRKTELTARWRFGWHIKK